MDSGRHAQEQNFLALKINGHLELLPRLMMYLVFIIIVNNITVLDFPLLYYD